MDIVVYTVNINGHDNLRPPENVESGVRYICVTDVPINCEPWEACPAWKRYDNERRNSRIPKILSHLFFNSEYTIYLDANYVLVRKPSEIIEKYLKETDIAFYRHPCRKSVYEEMECCRRESIGYGPEMERQIERYRLAGLNSNLWAGSFIVRRNTEAVRKFNEIWWKEYRDGCERDQIALPMAQMLSGIPITTLDCNIMLHDANLKMNFHAAFINTGDNPAFAGKREKEAQRIRRLEELCPE